MPQSCPALPPTHWKTRWAASGRWVNPRRAWAEQALSAAIGTTELDGPCAAAQPAVHDVGRAPMEAPCGRGSEHASGAAGEYGRPG